MSLHVLAYNLKRVISILGISRTMKVSTQSRRSCRPILRLEADSDAAEALAAIARHGPKPLPFYPARRRPCVLVPSMIDSSLRPAARSLASASSRITQSIASGVPSQKARPVWSSNCERVSG
jgi:hypothetical protein